jgi:hypothetical protein
MTNEQTTTFTGQERVLRHTFKESKVIAYAKYDTLLLSLLVIFHNGSEYEYYGVDQNTWDELVKAHSAGSYINSFLRKFKCQRIK